MIASALLTLIRKTRGPIVVETNNYHDEFVVQVVKSDLINMIQESFAEDQETGFTLFAGRFGKDYVNGQ